MKSFLAVTLSTALLAAATSGALACSFKKDVTAEAAPMTPIVTAVRSDRVEKPATPAVANEKKG